jgi:hypothetical protein
LGGIWQGDQWLTLAMGATGLKSCRLHGETKLSLSLLFQTYIGFVGFGSFSGSASIEMFQLPTDVGAQLESAGETSFSNTLNNRYLTIKIPECDALKLGS